MTSGSCSASQSATASLCIAVNAAVSRSGLGTPARHPRPDASNALAWWGNREAIRRPARNSANCRCAKRKTRGSALSTSADCLSARTMDASMPPCGRFASSPMGSAPARSSNAIVSTPVSKPKHANRSAVSIKRRTSGAGVPASTRSSRSRARISTPLPNRSTRRLGSVPLSR